MLSENWATLWEALAAKSPDAVAVVIGDRRLRWHELDERAGRLASGLTQRGVVAGTRVAQMLHNCPEYLESAYAAFKLRATPVNVNYRYKAPEIVHVLADAGASALVFHGAFADRVAEARPELGDLQLLVQVDDASGAPLLDGAVAYEDLLGGSEPMEPIERSGEDRLMLYTGGTTGLPKGVVWRHRDLFGALATTGYGALGRELPETASEVASVAAEIAAAGKSPVNMTAPPLMHGTALFLAFGTFVMGGTVVLLGGRSFDAAELVDLVAREGVTQLSIVGDAFAKPIVAELERREAAGEDFDLSSLERLVSTGATMSAESKRALMARAPSMSVMDMIGASEGGPFALAVTAPGQDPGATADFMALPGTVTLDAGSGEVLARGSERPGMLAVSGPMPVGYHESPDKTAEVFRQIDGVRYTVPGDMATIDTDGTVHLLGRGSVCINTGGEKVYPEEVEVAARSHPTVDDCVAVGIADDRFGEAVTLVASPAPGAQIDPDAVMDHVKERLASYKAPRRVVVVERVYRSPSGKADYRWARDTATVGWPP